MKIGILQCGHAAEEVQALHGDFDRMFAALLANRGLSFAVFDVENMEFPRSEADCDGWLITGSKHGAYEDHPFIPPLEDFIRAAHAAAIPVVGICFGHQIIAQALGGRVEKFAGGWSVGPTSYTTTGGETLAINAWHQDQVLDPPEGAETWASNDFCKHAALTIPGGILTLQPHPEFSQTILRDYLRVRGVVAGVPEAVMDKAHARLDDELDRDHVADLIADHFKKYARTTARA